MNKNEQFVITINRELGSGGRTVGRLLAEKLGVPFYDKAVIKALQEKYNHEHDKQEKNYTHLGYNHKQKNNFFHFFSNSLLLTILR